ncbi:MAG TPA: XRE family transcriptional regulator [Bacteroidales bacterium]|nr:XRE family transcriptional regulator [Bacteroidales bacterium]
MTKNQIIGEKISSLRSIKNIPVPDLAKKSGLSEKQYELIEKGESIPSLGVLIRITRALGVRMGTLLDDNDKEGPAVVREKEKNSSVSFSTNENESREHLTFMSLAPNKAGRHMEPFMIDIIPSNNNNVKSSHEGEEFIYVLEGSVIIYYGNDIIELGKGDSIYLDSIVSHLVTTREGKARILGIVYVPV